MLGTVALFAQGADGTTAIIVAVIGLSTGVVGTLLPAWLTYRTHLRKVEAELRSVLDREKLTTQPAPPPVVGLYKVSGFHATTSATYSGEAEISPAGAFFRVRWRTGPKVWEGVGVLFEGVLSVAVQGASGGAAGVAQYVIDRAASPLTLRGRWVYASDQTVSSETLTRTV